MEVLYQDSLQKFALKLIFNVGVDEGMRKDVQKNRETVAASLQLYWISLQGCLAMLVIDEY